MIILQCIVFDWILVNVFKVKVDHYFPLNADVTVYGAFTVTSDGRVGVNKEKKLERPLEVTAHPGDASSVRVSQGETVTTEQFLEFGTTDNSGSFEESASISVGKLHARSRLSIRVTLAHFFLYLFCSFSDISRACAVCELLLLLLGFYWF